MKSRSTTLVAGTTPHRRLILSVLILGWPCWLAAQQAMQASQVVPRLVNFSARAVDAEGKPVSGIAAVTFTIYKAQYEEAPLWMETQNVQPDAKGNYSVQLGATRPEGLPLDLFTSGEARWLGVRVNGGEEQSRVLLLSVPYALKAADAQTLGGLPPSAFVLAASGSQAPSSGTSAATAAAVSAPTIGGSGTQNYLPLWTDNNGDLGNSVLYQLGSGPSARIGINLTNPLTTLDVNGTGLMRGLFEMATTGFASPTKGYNSQPFNIESSAYNSGTGKYTLNHFQWQAEPTGNNTTTPAATLNLLYGTDPNQPTETGLKLNSKGVFTFAPGQTFPGTGTVTSVGLSAPASDFSVSGSPVTSSGTLGLNWSIAPTNANTANAIVKRDANGSFSTNSINAGGQITVDSTGSLSPILAIARSVGAAAVVGSATATGTTYSEGLEGSTLSSGTGSSGVVGLDHNSAPFGGSYTAGVTGRTFSPYGVGVLGFGKTLSNSAAGDIGNSRVGVWGDDASGTGVVASSDIGTALFAFNAGVAPPITSVNNNTGKAVYAANTSTSDMTMYVANNTTATTGVIFHAEDPQVQVNGSTAFCEINTRGGLGCTGDVYQNSPANGLVKALVYFDSTQPAGSQIVHCFNSALPEPGASTTPCGFTVTHEGLGLNIFDLGFPIEGRFIQATPAGGNSNHLRLGSTIESVSGSTVAIGTFYVGFNNDSLTDAPIYLSIF